MTRSTTIVALALAALGLALLLGSRAKPAAAPRVEEPAPVAAPSARAVSEPQLRAVQATVAANNRAGSDEAAAFRAAGWHFVSTPPPDARLLAYDPALLAGRESELRMQLLSTVPSPAQVANVATLARRAHDPATRLAAVEALGRLPDRSATRALIELLPSLDRDDDARAAIAPLIRPRSIDDPLAADATRLLDSPALSPVEKQQISYTLALIARRDRANSEGATP